MIIIMMMGLIIVMINTMMIILIMVDSIPDSELLCLKIDIKTNEQELKLMGPCKYLHMNIIVFCLRGNLVSE